MSHCVNQSVGHNGHMCEWWVNDQSSDPNHQWVLQDLKYELRERLLLPVVIHVHFHPRPLEGALFNFKEGNGCMDGCASGRRAGSSPVKGNISSGLFVWFSVINKIGISIVSNLPEARRTAGPPHPTTAQRHTACREELGWRWSAKWLRPEICQPKH